MDPLLSKATILKGYWIDIKHNIPQNEAKALYDEGSLRGKLEIEFAMNRIRPAFIGELRVRGMELGN